MNMAGYLTPERQAEIQASADRRAKQDAEQAAAKLKGSSGVWPKYAKATLADTSYPKARLSAEDYEDYLRVCQDLSSLMNWPCTIILRGNNGPGKTHIISALVNAFCEAGKPARYTTAADFFLELKSTFGAEGRTQMDLVKRYRGYAMLALDEIDVRSDSAWENQVLRGLVDARYASMVATVLVTNKSADEVNGYFSTAIRDRIREDGAIVNCDWPSLRGRTEAA
jgi:DNA replication protein DnaC